VGPGDLDQALCGVDIPFDPNVLAGIKGSEDAGVYRLTDDLALVQTVDFFTPIVDDPRIFGRAAAANSLSDVYAMGGRPITAMNVVCFPVKKLGVNVLRTIIQGGLDILREAGVALVGGHSVEDAEPKYGLSVAGLVHPDRMMTNAALRPGDCLILTKAVGTGVIATALKGGLASGDALEAMTASICSLNRTASEVAVRLGVRACTDVTGFGLLGHLAEMARASKCRIRVRAVAVPVLTGAAEAVAVGMVPAGTHANRSHFSSWVSTGHGLSAELSDLLFDPQTSGGLILGIPQDHADELVATLQADGVGIAAAFGEVLGHDSEGRVLVE
jgi:selenide, water dikinase